MMKDEAPFLLEWYAHHLAVGFTKILVYTNDCTDGTDDMLIRLEELGLGYHRRNDIEEGKKPQPSAINYAQSEPVVRGADWVLMFDADEFLCINYGDGTLDQMLDAAGDANGIVITWRIFGSSNIVDWSRAPVTEQYLQAAPPTWNKGWGVKTLFKFDHDKWKLGIHRPSIKNKHLETEFPETVKWLNGSGLPMEDYFKFRGWRSIRRTVGYQWAQMNHYAVKSVDSYAVRKFRGNVNNKKDKYNADYWALQDRNEVRDESILRYVDKRKAIMDELLTDPVLNRLHFAALERVEARLEEYRKTDSYEALKQSLIEASNIPITQVSAKPPKARDPAAIAALMSQVEKQQAAKPAHERRTKPSPEFEDTFEGGDGLVAGEIDLSADVPVEWVANHAIELPADARIFLPSQLDMVLQGKYQRKLARLNAGLIKGADKILELGSGTGFLAIHSCVSDEGCKVVAQEDNGSRVAIARLLLERNALNFGDRLSFDHTRCVWPGDPDRTVEAINDAITSHRPDILRISYRDLTPSILARLKFGDVKRIILVVGAAHAYHREMQLISGVQAVLSEPEIVVLQPEDGFTNRKQGTSERPRMG